MTKIGVLYECEETLNSNVLAIKQSFKKKNIKSYYLNHPVHISAYVFQTKNYSLKKIAKDFKLLKFKISPVLSKINNWKIFENDILTGLNTLCLEVELTNELLNLQDQIVSSLYKYSIKNNELELKAEFLKSYKKFGYPFVGKHWIPHITIGSFDLSLKEIELSKEKEFSFPKKIVFDNFSLFHIEGDTHTLLEKIKF